MSPRLKGLKNLHFVKGQTSKNSYRQGCLLIRTLSEPHKQLLLKEHELRFTNTPNPFLSISQIQNLSSQAQFKELTHKNKKKRQPLIKLTYMHLSCLVIYPQQ
ncbi:hypothetical protein GYH30_047283 [Glycine max]|nr:hypothetical protein GYH30_047283 [Glycine max]